MMDGGRLGKRECLRECEDDEDVRRERGRATVRDHVRVWCKTLLVVIL